MLIIWRGIGSIAGGGGMVVNGDDDGGKCEGILLCYTSYNIYNK